jgi:arsenate reductase
MAEAWFNHLSLGMARAASCGTMPASRFDFYAVQAMSEVCVPIRPHLPKAINQQMVARAGTILILGRDVPAYAFPNAELWDLQDPTGQSFEVYRELREQIRVRVENLLHRLYGTVAAPTDNITAFLQTH